MKYKISIPDPCHQDWNKMTPNEKGRFCDACEKTIVDFSNLSKFELAKRLNAGEKLCGRFNATQLNTPLSYRAPLYRKGSAWVLSLAGLLAVTASAVAQPTADPSFSLMEMVEHERNNLEPNKDTILLKAIVYDLETRAPLSNVHIRVKEYKKIGTQTNEHGQFELAVPNKMAVVTLVFQSDFLEEKQIMIDLRKRDLPAKIYLQSSLEAIGESIIVAEKDTSIENPDTRITSTVVDEKTDETIPFAAIRIIVDGELAATAETDFDGNFEMDIPPYIQQFEMEVSNSSYEIVRLSIDLEKEDIPEKIEMSVEEHILMGVVISEPVDQSNQYLGEQIRKYYR